MRGGLVFKAHRLLYHSTLGLRVIKKETDHAEGEGVHVGLGAHRLHEPLFQLTCQLSAHVSTFSSRVNSQLICQLSAHVATPSGIQSCEEQTGRVRRRAT